MANAAWSAPTSPEAMRRRVGGRRRINAIRKARADLRRNALLCLLKQWGGLRWKMGKELAKRLGVSRQTISNDLRRLGLRYV
jgi:hypothetical protein